MPGGRMRREGLVARREELGLTQETLAQRLGGVSVSTVARTERGESTPRSWYRRRWADALEVTVDELDALLAAGMPPRAPTSYPAAEDAAPSRTADADYVMAVRESTQHIVDLDGQHGGDDLVALAVRAFRASHQRLASGLFVPDVERDLSAAVGEAGEVAAWVAYDADRQTLSRQLNQEALLISRLAGDRSMELFELANLAMQSIHLGRSVEALRIAETVLDDGRLAGRTAALFHIRVGRALAQLGERRRALETLGRARALLDDGITAHDPSWTWWVDDSELDWHEAMALAGLDDWITAVDRFRRAYDRRPPDKPRSRYNDLAHLLEALVAVGAWRDAEPVMVEAISYTGDVSSARTTMLLRRVVEQIERSAPASASLVDTSIELRDRLASPA